MKELPHFIEEKANESLGKRMYTLRYPFSEAPEREEWLRKVGNVTMFTNYVFDEETEEVQVVVHLESISHQKYMKRFENETFESQKGEKWMPPKNWINS